MKPNRLAGHELPNEGRVRNIYGTGYVNYPGPTKCSCGKKSPDLPNTTARKRWHREHKDEMRAKLADQTRRNP